MNALADVEESFDKEQTLAELEATFVLPPETSKPEPAPVDPEQLQLQLYGTSLRYLETLKSKSLTLQSTGCESKEGYEDTRRMIGLLRTTRCRIEKRRKEHNQEHQEAIRFVNGIAKSLTDFIVNLEDPLKHNKALVDEAKERAKRAAEEAERRADEERRAAAVAKIEAELKAEREARAAADALLQAEREQLEEARRQLDQERAAAARREAERLAKIKAEEEEAARAVQAGIEARERAARLEAIKPDVEKLQAFADVVRHLSLPVVHSPEARAALTTASNGLQAIAHNLGTFQP